MKIKKVIDFYEKYFLCSALENTLKILLLWDDEDNIDVKLEHMYAFQRMFVYDFSRLYNFSNAEFLWMKSIFMDFVTANFK